MQKLKLNASIKSDFSGLLATFSLTCCVSLSDANQVFPTLADYSALLPLHASALARNPVSGADLWWDSKREYGFAWHANTARLALATESNHAPHLWQYAQGLALGDAAWFGWVLENETRQAWRNGLRLGLDMETALGTRLRVGGKIQPKSWNESGMRYDFSAAFRPLPDGLALSPSWIGFSWPWSAHEQAKPALLASLQFHQLFHFNAALDLESQDVSLSLGSALGANLWAGISQWPSRRPFAHVHWRNPAFRHYLLSHGHWWEMRWDKAWMEGEGKTDWFGDPKAIGFEQVKTTLDAAERERDLKGLYITLRGWQANLAMVQEVARRFDRLRKQGKKIVIHADLVTPLGLLLGAHASRFMVHPQGYFGVQGLSVDLTFYRGLLDKIGIRPEFIRHGRYKAFDEPFMRDSPSPEYQANTQEWLADLWAAYKESLAQGGRRDTSRLESLVSRGELSLDSAKAYGLVDTLLNEQAAKSMVLTLAEGADWTSRKWDEPAPQDPVFGALPAIGLLTLTGPIEDDGNSMWPLMSESGFSPRPTLARLRALAKDERIRAVVIRLDSPGGSAQASDIIAEAIDSLRESGKPVILSVGGLAASGGYYMATACSKIVAEPSSMVGSIGVVWGKVSTDSLSSKLGIRHTTIKTSEHADAQSLYRPFKPEEKAVIQRHLDGFYDTFTRRVAKARGFDSARLDSVCEGRVFLGRRALRNGLIDTLGGLETAILLARDMARLKGEERQGWTVVSVDPSAESLSIAVSSAMGFASPTLGSFKPESLEAWRKKIVQWQSPYMWAISPASLWQQPGWMH